MKIRFGDALRSFKEPTPANVLAWAAAAMLVLRFVAAIVLHALNKQWVLEPRAALVVALTQGVLITLWYGLITYERLNMFGALLTVLVGVVTIFGAITAVGNHQTIGLVGVDSVRSALAGLVVLPMIAVLLRRKVLRLKHANQLAAGRHQAVSQDAV